jgi:hypothetical protein
MTDDLSQAHKCRIQAGVIVPAHGRVVLWGDNPDAGPTHLGFSLNKDQGVIALTRPDDTWIDRVGWTNFQPDFSAAREPDGSTGWAVEWRPTPGAANAAGSAGPAGMEDASQPPEQVPDPGDMTDLILGYDQIPQFSLQIAGDGVASLMTNPDVYVHANLTYNGRTLGPVGVRLKGGNSFEPFDHKPSLKIKMDEYVDNGSLLGLKSLTLDNMHSDPAMMHERMAYAVARAAGVPASRSNTALVTVNGQFYGVYANVESMKKELIGRWFDNNEGPLFEQFDVDYTPHDVPAFQLESGTDDRTLLNGLANALAISDADTAIAQASQYADISAFQHYWALCTVIGQFDATPYSIPGDDAHLYADPTTNRLKWLPWGMDETFQDAMYNPVTTTYSVLAAKCKQSSSCFQGYADDVWEILDVTDHMDLESMRRHIQAQIAPYAAQDTRKPYTNEDVATWQQNLYWFIHERRMDLQQVVPPHS